MAIYKLHKGLDIPLLGRPDPEKNTSVVGRDFGLMPGGFVGVLPKVVVREGDHVKAGDFLFVDKKYPEVGFASPVSGEVKSVVRGDRRKLLCVKLEADEKQQYKEFPVKDSSKMSAEEMCSLLMGAGLFGYIRQLPYAVSAVPSAMPKAIFVSGFRDMPLSSDFEVELKGNEEAFQSGLDALARIAKTYLGVGKESGSSLRNMKNVEINEFLGPCPAGNVGVQVNHVCPVNKGETVWTVDPIVVVFIGRLMKTGKVDLTRKVALCGSEMESPCYVTTKVGQSLRDLIGSRVKTEDDVRLINGNVLTGTRCSLDDYLAPLVSEVTAIPEGSHRDEMFGWIMPRLGDFSVNRSYFSWLQGKRHLVNLDTRIKGGQRHMIMSGEYDRVFPMDIYPEYLIKSIIAGDIDKMELLGIYEVSPEDFALAEFVCSSKMELQRIVREGLDMLRKENA